MCVCVFLSTCNTTWLVHIMLLVDLFFSDRSWFFPSRNTHMLCHHELYTQPPFPFLLLGKSSMSFLKGLNLFSTRKS